jgi:tape measure domain-containing protein
MAGNAGQIRAGGAFVTLGLQDKLEQGLQRASAQLKSFAGSAARLGGPLAAMSGGLFATLGMPTKLASEMETTATSFEVMLGSAAKAEELLKNLAQLGAETPFEFPELADAAKLLLAFGSDAATLPDELRRLGDVASGVGMPIGELAELYGKMRTQGTLYAEDLNQLLGRGIPALQMFADQMGVPVDQVKKLGSEGKITFPMLEQMMLDLTSTGGRFAGMMSKQSATTAGKWSTFKDNVNASLRSVGEAMLPIVNRAMDLASQIIAGFQPMLPVIAQVVPAIVAVATALGVVGGSLLAIAGGATAFAWVLGALAPVAALAAGIGAIGVAVWALQDELQPIFDWMAGGFSWVSEMAQRAFGGISDALAAGDIGLAGQIAMTGLKLAFTTGLETIAGVFGATIETTSRMIAELYKQFMQVVTKLNSWRAQASDWIAQRIGDVVGVDVQSGDSAALASAQEWENAIQQIDTSALGEGIAEALDPSNYQAELDRLIEQAAQAKREVEELAAQQELEQPSTPKKIQAAGKQALEASFASIGNFGAAMLERMAPQGSRIPEQQLKVQERQLKALESIDGQLGNVGGPTFGP